MARSTSDPTLVELTIERPVAGGFCNDVARLDRLGPQPVGQIQQIDDTSIFDDKEHAVEGMCDGGKAEHGDRQPHDIAERETCREGHRPVRAAPQYPRYDGGNARPGRGRRHEQRRRKDH